MTRPQRLVMIIPRDATPESSVDLSALCAPAGVRPPAHLRLRFPCTPASASLAAQARLAATPPVNDGQSDAEAVQTSAARPPRTSSKTNSEARTAPVATGEATGPNAKAEGSLRAATPPPSDADAETGGATPAPAPAAAGVLEAQHIAASVESFVDREERASRVSTPPDGFSESRSEDLELGVMTGVRTLVKAIIVLTILGAIALSIIERPSGERLPEVERAGIAEANAPPKTLEAGEAGPPAPTSANTPSLEPPAKTGGHQAQADQEPPSAAPALAPTSDAFSFGAEVGEVAPPSARSDDAGFSFGADLGIEEREPGLLDRIEDLRARARELATEQRSQEALALYEALLELKPGDPDGLFQAATIHLRDERFDRATPLFEEALRRDPASGRALNNYGVALRSLGRLDEARLAFQRSAASKDPNALVNIAHEQRRSGRLDDALDSYRRALALAPSNGPARYGLALALSQTEPAQAKELFEALTSHPGLGALAHAALGRIALSTGDLSGALVELEQALEIDPELSDARVERANALLRLQRPSEAAKELSRVVRERSSDTVAWMNLGIALMKSGQADKAKQCYEYALSLGNPSAALRFNYARCAEYFGNYLVAIEQYEKALATGPYFWQASYNLGLIHQRGDQHEKALAFFDRAISTFGGHAPAHLSRARSLLALERREQGRSALRSFLTLAAADDPLRPAVEESLEALESPSPSTSEGRPRQLR